MNKIVRLLKIAFLTLILAFKNAFLQIIYNFYNSSQPKSLKVRM